MGTVGEQGGEASGGSIGQVPVRALVEALPEVFFLKDTRGRFILANRATAELMGVAHTDELIGKTDHELCARELADEHLADERALLVEGRGTVERLERNASGEHPRWVSVTKLPLADEAGSLIGIVGMGKDITEARRREEALAAERNLLKTLVDLLPYAVYAKDRECRKVMANRSDVEYLGRSTEAEVLGKTDFDLLPREIASSYHADDQAVLASGEALVDREDYNPASGRWYLTSKLPLRAPTGEITGLVGLSQDVTEGRRSREALKRLNRELRAITRCNQVIVRARDERTVANEICDLMCTEAGYLMAWVGFVDPGEHGRVRPFAWSGDEDGYLSAIESTLTNDARGGGPTAAAIRERSSVVVSDLQADEPSVPWGVAASERGYRSVLAIPLTDQGSRPFGALTIYAGESGAFPDEEVQLLAGLAGDLAFGIASLRERAERERAERELRSERNLLRTLVDVLPDSIYVKDTACRKTLSNAVDLRILGAEREAEVLGTTDLDWFPIELAEGFYRDDRSVVQTGVSLLDREGSFVDADGRKRWLLTSKFPLRDETGRVIGLVGVGRDITERKAWEAKLREQAELLNRASDAILVRDHQGRIRYWNRGAERAFGWTEAEALGREADELLHGIHPERANEALAAVVERGEWFGDLRARAKDGRQLIAESRWTLVREEGEGRFSILCVSTDVTEARAIQAQLLRAQRLESLGVLAGGIAHDLNNVLTPIISGMEGVMPAVTDVEARRILAMIVRSARRGALVVKQLLGFARGVEGERKLLHPEEVLDEVVSIVRETFPRSIEVVYGVPPPLAAILADATQLHQVLMNLCINARDAMSESGTLTLSARDVELDEAYARTHLEAKPGAYVLLEVEDTGSGMSTEVLERIFDPFYTTKGPRSGTGLGLSTALSIVKAHEGFITVYSELGHGSTFRVYLPAAVLETKAAVEEPSHQRAVEEGALILVVDDEEAVRETTRYSLERNGYRVITSADGSEAIAAYVEHRHELRGVIMDMMMPHMDGAAAIRTIRRIDPHARVIATSGLPANGYVAEAEGVGAQAFLAKPYSTTELLQTLAEVLRA